MTNRIRSTEMNYCPFCGEALTSVENFCPFCGESLPQTNESPADPIYKFGMGQTVSSRDAAPTTLKHGVILTNAARVGGKLFGARTITVAEGEHIETHAWVSRVLSDYCRQMKSAGVDYRICDVDLEGGEWPDYAQRLDEFYRREFYPVPTEPVYLFIIGGNDVIPMPQVVNPFFMNSGDKPDQEVFEQTVDADMLYACAHDVATVVDGQHNVLHSGLLKTPPRYYIGRLPMEEGRLDLMEIQGQSYEPYKGFQFYFARALDEMISPVGADGQRNTNNIGIDINTHTATTCASAEMVIPRLLKGTPLSDTCEDAGISSTYFTVPNPDEGANEKRRVRYNISDMLTFVLHGSDIASHCNYYGQDKQMQATMTAFTINQMCRTQAKVVSGVCCWGARFHNFARVQSMVLNAIYNNTLLFMGASRSARGHFDVHLQQGMDICMSEHLLRYYLQRLLSGLPAGRALEEAKRYYLAHYEPDLEAKDALATVLEFNLFGDPALAVTPLMDISEVDRPDPAVEAARMPSHATAADHTELLYTRPQSILQRVASLVDRNIADIRTRVTKALYDQYNLPPDELMFIHRMSGSDGGKKLRFTYRHDSLQLSQHTFVDTDNSGKIRFIAAEI